MAGNEETKSISHQHSPTISKSIGRFSNLVCLDAPKHLSASEPTHVADPFWDRQTLPSVVIKITLLLIIYSKCLLPEASDHNFISAWRIQTFSVHSHRQYKLSSRKYLLLAKYHSPLEQAELTLLRTYSFAQ